jgi:selenocysteine-specific elongation factor
LETQLFVIGTAGHVDHGKSTLVKALTGIDPDRLREEKEREMTIDLGFAWLKLPSGLEIGVIDVPGHEHFIKNMLAGVSGMDMALLVVAANESIKQQTREHMDILDLMEVPRSIIVITQTDLADEDQVVLVSLEMEDLIKPTHLAGSPIVPVSALTGQGLPELTATIDKVLSEAQPRPDKGKPRLPIDRVFTIAGSGTVVTGTLVDGTLTIGNEIEILPRDIKARIRGLQAHKNQLASIGPGNRVAINLAGLSATDLKRGDILTKPGWLTSTSRVDAKLRLLTNLKYPLKHNTEVSFHTGSADVMARVRLLENDEVQPGQTTWAQIILEEPLAVINGDHYVIRSTMDTLGGGIIIDSHPKQHLRRTRLETAENLKTRAEGKTESALLAILNSRQHMGFADLIAQSNLSQEIAQLTIESLIQQGALFSAGEGKNSVLYTSAVWKLLTDSTLEIVGNFHRKFPMKPGMPKAELSSKIKSVPNLNTFLQKLCAEGTVIEEGTLVRLPSHSIKLTTTQQHQMDEFLRQLAQNPYSPSTDVVLERDLLNLIIERGQVIKTTEEIIFSASAYKEMTIKVIDYIKKNGKITLGETRDLFQTSRKYAQALLEFMDEKKLTKRVGDERILGE